MAEDDFEFETYRLIVVEDAQLYLFEKDLLAIRDDDDIRKIIQHATEPPFASETETSKAVYRWAIREFTELAADDMIRRVVVITLARSTVTRVGWIVTDDEIITGHAEFEPPLAETIHLLFDLKRHVVAVERLSAITSTGKWRSALAQILNDAAKDLRYSSMIDIAPIPREEEILDVFRSFSRLTRLRVKLRLPNPELSRFSYKLYEEMRRGGIREYLQDMYSPKGLNQSDGELPHASAEIAQAGYKDGSVVFEGVREGRRDKVATGNKAVRGIIPQLKQFVRGIHANAKAKETQSAVQAILGEIDRVAPPPENDS